METSNFLQRTLVTCFSICLMVALINLIIDPYDLYGLVDQPGFNSNKITHAKNDRMLKAYQIKSQRPDILLLGTSRVQYGLDPQQKDLKKYGQRPYNAGLLGTDMTTILHYAQHAMLQNPVHFIVLGLDPLMFGASQSKKKQPEYQHRLSQTSQSLFARSSVVPWSEQDLFTTLFSLTAFQTSLKTVWLQQRIESDILIDGRRNPNELERRTQLLGGQRMAFLYSEKEYLKGMMQFRDADSKAMEPNTDALKELLQLARDNQIDLRLFFSPLHVRMYEVHRIAQAEESFLQWQKNILEILTQEGIKSKQNPFPLWDFTTLPHSTTESVPSLHDQTALMQNFWDTAHYTASLGNKLFENILQTNSSHTRQNPLTPKDLKKSQENYLQQGVSYFQFHLEERQEIQQWLQPIASNKI